MMKVSPHMERRRNALWEDMADFARSRMVELGIDAKAADLVASDLVDHTADRWGGQTMSFPKDYLRRLSLQETELYAKFNGNNYAELAIEYGMGERGMRKKIARIQARLRAQARGAPDLFSSMA